MTGLGAIGIEKKVTGKPAVRFPQISFWRTVVALIFAACIYSMYARFAPGFQASTNLTDPQPWGLWVGLGTLWEWDSPQADSPSRRRFIFWDWSATGRFCARRC